MIQIQLMHSSYMSQAEVNQLLDAQDTPRNQLSFCSSGTWLRISKEYRPSTLDPQTIKNEMSFGKAKSYLEVIEDLRRQLDVKQRQIEDLQLRTRTSLEPHDSPQIKEYQGKLEEMVRWQRELIEENNTLHSELRAAQSQIRIAQQKMELFSNENRTLLELRKQEKGRYLATLQRLEMANERLRRKCLQTFSTTAQGIKSNTFQDILMLQRTSLEEAKSMNQQVESPLLYIYFHSQRIYFQESFSVLEFQKALRSQIKDVQQVAVYQPDGEVEYSSSTPLQLVLQDDMLLRLNKSESYIILNKVESPPVIDLIENYPLQQHPIHEYFKDIDVPQRTKVVLSNFIQRMLVEIEKNKQLTYDKNLLMLILKKVILKMGLYASNQKESLDRQIAFLVNKESNLTHLKNNLIKELEIKEQMTLYQIYFYIFCQIAFTQYGTYVVWGWDVMEPVTFMLGVIDMIIAYNFWMKTTKAYTYDNVLKAAVNKHLSAKLADTFNYIEELNDVQKMIEYLRFKQMIYSANIDEVINVIEGAIEEKQAKLQAQEEDD